MRPEARKFLYDIQQAVELLHQFRRGKTFDDYSGDAMFRSAVERQFEIIGEALSQLAKVDLECASQQ
ncbi:MAG TPA: HepT-like ribonuclease domain-containing protein [Candidatus Obscuribacterales bacterium]